jgi:hypothetical protein
MQTEKKPQSKLLSRESKLKLYRTLIRPIVKYASETWLLTENSIQKLMIFERKALGNFFGPTKELNGLWRIKTNEELDDLIQRKNIISRTLPSHRTYTHNPNPNKPVVPQLATSQKLQLHAPHTKTC